MKQELLELGARACAYLWTQKHPGTSLSFVACFGAKTSDLLATQLQAVTSATTLVTMTIGGNDIGFANLIYQCRLSDCSAALDSTRANLEATLGSALDQVYTTVKSHAALGARVVVLGYPRVFSGKTCFGTLGISSTEESKANALADALDQVVATHAAKDASRTRARFISRGSLAERRPVGGPFLGTLPAPPVSVPSTRRDAPPPLPDSDPRRGHAARPRPFGAVPASRTATTV